MILYNNFKILNQYEWYPILYTMSDSEDLFALIDAIRNRDHPNDILKLIQSEIDVNKQDWLRVDRADGDRSVWGRARRGDNARARRCWRTECQQAKLDKKRLEDEGGPR